MSAGRRAGGIAARMVVLALIFVVGAGSASLAAASSPAHAADIISLCPMTLPSESSVPPGNGVDSVFSNQNLIGAPANTSGSGTIPKYASNVSDMTEATMANMNLYEVAGLRGGDYVTTTHKPVSMLKGQHTAGWMLEKGRDCSLMPFLWTALGNVINSGKNMVLQGIIALKDVAFSGSPFQFLYDKAAGPLAALVTGFVFPMYAIMIGLLGINVLITAVKGKGLRGAMGQILMTFTTLILLAVLYANSANVFTTLAKIGDEVVGTVNSVVADTLLQGLTSDGDPATDVCATGPSLSGKDNIGLRRTNCIIADGLSYTPWALGQYGNTIMDAEYSTVGLDANPSYYDQTAYMTYGDNTGTGHYIKDTDYDKLKDPDSNRLMAVPCYVNWKGCNVTRAYVLTQLSGPSLVNGVKTHDMQEACFDRGADRAYTDSGGKGGAEDGKRNDETSDDDDDDYGIYQTGPYGKQYALYVAQCYPTFAQYRALDTSPAAYAFHGDQASNRLSQAFISLIGAAVTGFAVAILCLMVLIWHARLFGLFFVGPLKLLVASMGGKSHMAQEWFTAVGFAYAMRILYGIAVTFVVLLVVWVFQTNDPVALKLIYLALILWSFFKMIGKVQESLQVSSSPGGGDGGDRVARGAAQGAKKGAGIAGTAAIGGAAGIIGGSVAGKRAAGNTLRTMKTNKQKRTTETTKRRDSRMGQLSAGQSKSLETARESGAKPRAINKQKQEIAKANLGQRFDGKRAPRTRSAGVRAGWAAQSVARGAGHTARGVRYAVVVPKATVSGATQAARSRQNALRARRYGLDLRATGRPGASPQRPPQDPSGR